MKVLADLTYIRAEDEFSGVAVFSYTMLPALHELAPDMEIMGLVSEDNSSMIRRHFPWMKTVALHLRNIHALQNSIPYLNLRAVDRIVRRSGADIFFVPFFGDRCLRTSAAPTLAVMHDAQGFKTGPNALRIALYKYFTLRAARHVDRMVTISEHSRLEILSKLKTLKAPLDVIGQSLPLHSSADEYKPDTRQPYILTVNTLVEYKNHLTLIKAFEKICGEIPHRLIIKGLRSDYSERVLQPYIRSHSLEGRITIESRRFSPDQMDALYRGASLFVSCSTMEGFGLTPLEATMRGVPAICADIPVVRSTTLGALEYYAPPTDADALAAAMRRVLSAPRDMRETAARLESHYSPRRQAEAYLDIMQKFARK